MSHYCSFPHIIGLNRVLRAQTYAAQHHAEITWPVPNDNQPSCNVVISGKPGTGKTSLALSMAYHLRMTTDPTEPREVGPATVLYFSLEQAPESLMARAADITDTIPGDKKYLDARGPLVSFVQNTMQLSVELKNAPDPITCTGNVVLYPRLTPPQLEQTGQQDDTNIFWQRFHEIRTLLDFFIKSPRADRAQESVTATMCNTPSGAAVAYWQLSRKPSEKGELALPPLRMVVIDSVSIFGDQPMSRFLLEQLFALFEEKRVVALFVMEDQSDHRESRVAPEISYLADVAISMNWSHAQGYCFQTLEVSKSRCCRNVSGPQQVKVGKQGISVYPTLHSWYSYLLSAETHPMHPMRVPDDIHQRLVFHSEINNIIEVQRNRKYDSALVHALLGDRHTGKVAHALYHSVGCARSAVASENQTDPLPQQFLLVSLGTTSEFDLNNIGFALTPETDESFVSKNKGHFSGLLVSGPQGSTDERKLLAGYQLWVAPGYLLPEELVYFIHRILVAKPGIARVIIEDIGQIPIRFPVITQQIREYCNFFSVLTEMFKVIGVDCCFVCSTDVSSDAKLEGMVRNIAHGYFQFKRPDLPDGERTVTYTGLLKRPAPQITV